MKQLIIFLIALLFFSCSLFLNSDLKRDDTEDSVFAVEQFNYKMTKEINLSIDTGYSGVPISIKYDNTVHLQVVSDRRGKIERVFSVPGYYEYLDLETDFIGLLQSAKVAITEETLFFDYTNPSHFFTKTDLPSRTAYRSSSSTNYSYGTLGSWNSEGKPDYLMTRDVISHKLISQINQSLPEKAPVPEHNAHYLDTTAEKNLHLQEEADVYVTFVHEGAGYRNALGFFTYIREEGPPQSVSTEDITLIFPNVSYTGGGGSLISGDKVHLGRFPQGTSIGWVIIANGFSPWTSTVSRGLNQFFSIDSLNPDALNHKQHAVLLEYEEESLFILSFEDLLRPYGDNDFNDAVFYVTTNPLSAVDNSSIVNTDEAAPPSDSDNDGIADANDPEPLNSNVVSYQYTPAQNSWGTLAFEDLWPHQGDYDFNDLVIDYRFRESFNSDGRIIAIRCEFTIKGILASMRNGFAIELGVEPDDVRLVSGGEYSRGYTARNSNGTEKRQRKAVIIAFEDANLHYDPNGPAKLLVLDIEFSRAVMREELGFAPYNPFIMSNGERGREVHLPGMKQTDLAHYEYFGSADDNSVLGSELMYKTSTDRPWALNLPDSFHFPHDDVHITQAYNYFSTWVSSAGNDYSDWFLDNPGYRNKQFLVTLF